MTGKNSLPRIAFFDNAKAILIFLVVLGHALALISDQSRFSDALLNCIYLFHMPAFVFISGLFSKHSYTVNHGLNVNRIIGFLALYLLIYTGFWGIGQISNQGWEYNAFFTNSLAWYMLAMAWWTLLTPAALKLGAVPTLTFFLILSLIIGFYSDFGGFLVLSRTIVFAPFFFLGFFFDQNIVVEKLQRIHKSRLGLTVCATTLIALLAASFLLEELANSFHLIAVGYNSYSSIGGVFSTDLKSFVGRAVFYPLAIGSSLVFFSLIPHSKSLLSALGRRTLSVYSLHALILNCATWIAHLNEPLDDLNSIAAFCIVLAASLLLTLVLSWKPISTPFSKILRYGFIRPRTETVN